jgi:spore germination protein KA
MKLIQRLLKRGQPSEGETENSNPDNTTPKDPLKLTLQENLTKIQETLGYSTDIVVREFDAGSSGEIKLGMVFTDGLTDDIFVSDFILKALTFDIRKTDLDSNAILKENTLDIIKKAALPAAELSEVSDFEELFLTLLSGDTILLIDGVSQALAIDSKGWVDRGIEEPNSETVVRGPKDGFTETLRTNTALLRRKIRDPNLWIEALTIGRRTKTDVAIAYIKGIASDEVIQEVQKRLKNINVDAVLESGFIEELIQDAPYSPFPTVQNTERPDKVAAGLLEGRVAIITDGTPFVLIVPIVFTQFFQASEDYYNRFDVSSFIRILRFLCFFLALLVPSLYIAITTFHQEMIPTPLLTSVAAQREGVPFPAAVEALLMEFTFEILREAGIRLPKAIGSAVSIVGGLILGEAAVMAGIVSPIMVIVVALTAMSNFVIPSFSLALSLRSIRFAFLFLAASFGLYGIVLGLIAMVLHLCSLQSFGVPYMSPMGPYTANGQGDALVRSPRYGLFKRPDFITNNNITRGRNPQKRNK